MSTFSKLDIRIARLVEASPLPKARCPAYRIAYNVGALGMRSSSAQITVAYPEPSLLAGRLVAVVANLPERRVAGFVSQVLTLGMDDVEGTVWLVRAGAGGDRNGGEGLVGRRVVLEGEPGGAQDGSNAIPLTNIDEFLACGIVKGENGMVQYNGTNLGVYVNDLFIPIIAPEQAPVGAVMH